MKPVVYALRRICSCLNVRMCVYGFTRDKLRVRRKSKSGARCVKCKKRCQNSITSFYCVSTAHTALRLYTFLTRPHVPVK